MWLIKRLKLIGATTKQLIEVYTQQVRIVLEVAVPVWHPTLKISDQLDIERVQKSAFHIILGNYYEGYEKSIAALGLESLNERRKRLCKTFDLKSAKSDKFSSWFKENNKRKITRRTKSKYRKVETRTKRIQYPIRLKYKMRNGKELKTCLRAGV